MAHKFTSSVAEDFVSSRKPVSPASNTANAASTKAQAHFLGEYSRNAGLAEKNLMHYYEYLEETVDALQHYLRRKWLTDTLTLLPIPIPQTPQHHDTKGPLPVAASGENVDKGTNTVEGWAYYGTTSANKLYCKLQAHSLLEKRVEFYRHVKDDTFGHVLEVKDIEALMNKIPQEPYSYATPTKAFIGALEGRVDELGKQLEFKSEIAKDREEQREVSLREKISSSILYRAVYRMSRKEYQEWREWIEKRTIERERFCLKDSENLLAKLKELGFAEDLGDPLTEENLERFCKAWGAQIKTWSSEDFPESNVGEGEPESRVSETVPGGEHRHGDSQAKNMFLRFRKSCRM